MRKSHTASRADYWPHLYAKKPSGSALTKRYKPRLNGCRLKKGALPIYSPELADAWPDVEQPAPPGGQDWCKFAECAEELYAAKPSESYNVTKLYCTTLMVVERAVAAETWLD